MHEMSRENNVTDIFMVSNLDLKSAEPGIIFAFASKNSDSFNYWSITNEFG